MKQILLVVACVCAVASSAASAQGRYPPKPRPADGPPQSVRLMDNRTFLLSAAQGAFADIELGRMAVATASNAAVKAFGQRMVEAGEKMTVELKPLLRAQEIAPPVEIDARHKVTRDWLARLTGESFDRAYLAAMSAKQSNDVTFLQRATALTNDADVKAWAAQAMPVVQEHQALAKSINPGSK
jgi:putative membrane protein